MISEIKYSLLVPCYNAAKYIDRFLKQLSELIVPFDEVLFYDDASTDETIFQIEKRGFNVIKGLNNKGPGYSRNQLAIASSGTFIHFHDIDDEISPDFLVLVNDKLRDKDADVILGNADWINEKTRKLLISWRYDETELEKDSLSYFISNPLGIINTIYKKSTFLEIDGFDEKIKCWEDADLHVRLAAANATFKVIDKVIAFSLRHENGISQDQERCWECRLKFIENYLYNYGNILSNNVLKAELKKIQTVFINMGLFPQLKTIFDLDKKYNLNIESNKAKLIYYGNKIFPSKLLKKILAHLIKKINL